MVLDMRLALIRLSTLAFEASASADSANPANGAQGGTRTHTPAQALRSKRSLATITALTHIKSSVLTITLTTGIAGTDPVLNSFGAVGGT